VDLAAIGARHDAVAFFVSAEDASGSLNEVLRRLRDVPRLVERLRAVGAVTPKKEWQALLESIVALLQLAEVRATLGGRAGAHS
jgi:DNA mismatch repair ATPase MutS